MFRKISLSALTVLATLATCGSTNATSIAISNPSFESPVVDSSGIGFAVTDWASAPDNNGTVDPSKDSRFSGGLANLDLNQAGWFGVCLDGPGVNRSLSQDLPATYEAGQSYTLTASIGRFPTITGHDNDTARVALYWMDGTVMNVIAGGDIAWSAASATSLTDMTAILPAVHAGDACVGKAIGVWIGAGTVTAGSGYYWVADNVRLTSAAVPEPSAMVLLCTAVTGLLAYAWRKRN